MGGFASRGRFGDRAAQTIEIVSARERCSADFVFSALPYGASRCWAVFSAVSRRVDVFKRGRAGHVGDSETQCSASTPAVHRFSLTQYPSFFRRWPAPFSFPRGLTRHGATR